MKYRKIELDVSGLTITSKLTNCLSEEPIHPQNYDYKPSVYRDVVDLTVVSIMHGQGWLGNFITAAFLVDYLKRRIDILGPPVEKYY